VDISDFISHNIFRKCVLYDHKLEARGGFVLDFYILHCRWKKNVLKVKSTELDPQRPVIAEEDKEDPKLLLLVVLKKRVPSVLGNLCN
jgi:hypothetical protein